MRSKIKAIVKGRVQGVGYRYFAYREALALRLNGYVKNLPDGDVEVVAEGEENSIEVFLQILKKGPSFAHVTDIRISKLLNEETFNGFSIDY